MATNKFLPFDTDQSNILTDAEYDAVEERETGVTSGIADSKLHNKLFRQFSVMCAAIGEMLKNAGYNADDNSVSTLTSNLEQALTIKGPGGLVTVSGGGTGASSFTSGNLLVGNGTSAITSISTVPVNKGGTGLSTIASGQALIGNGTGNVQTRAITNLSSKSQISGSTNLATANAVLYHTQAMLNRTTAVNSGDANYTTCMSRGIVLSNTDVDPTANGTICFFYK